MTTSAVIERRMRSHRLIAPARSIVGAADHMQAVQAQEFWGGRWALAVRTRGEPSIRDVDRAFDRGEIVRSWTMRGTIHIVPARDLAWVLAVTGERQLRQAAAIHRGEGIDDAEVARAASAVRVALRGGNRLTRKEVFAVLETAGVVTAGQRGYHVLTNLSMRTIVCQGPVVPRSGGPTREQFFVLYDEWVTDAATPADPLAELFVRYIASHGPAGARDFAWWAGLPLGLSRSAAEAASDRVRVVADVAADDVADDSEPLYVAADRAPRRTPTVPHVLALPPFDEYYLSYADRTVPCAPELTDAVGPGKNGMVRPILVSRGRVVGVWSHSLAVGRHTDGPIPELFAPGAATTPEVVAALDRYRRFVTA